VLLLLLDSCPLLWRGPGCEVWAPTGGVQPASGLLLHSGQAVMEELKQLVHEV
jgi:hypothetical protein